jgi:hypothetical protein
VVFDPARSPREGCKPNSPLTDGIATDLRHVTAIGHSLVAKYVGCGVVTGWIAAPLFRSAPDG